MQLSIIYNIYDYAYKSKNNHNLFNSAKHKNFTQKRHLQDFGIRIMMYL